MNGYVMMERWVKTIRGCHAWMALVSSTPGGPTEEALREAQTWMDDTLNRIRDQATEA